MATIVEQLRKLLPDIEISDDFASKIQEVFKTALEEKTHEIEENYKEKLNEVVEKANAYADYVKEETNPENIMKSANDYAEYVVEYMSDKVDAYCDFIVEKFIEDNKSTLVETHEFNKMAETLRAIREVFETNYFALNDTSPNKKIVDELKETTESYNDLFNKHVELQEQIEKYSQYIEQCNREHIFEKLTYNLAETQKEKLQSIVEKTQFSTLGDFEEGVKLLIKEFHSKNESEEKQEIVTEEVKNPTSIPSESDSRMKAYLERL